MARPHPAEQGFSESPRPGSVGGEPAVLAPIDIEQRHPWLRLTLHLGLPLSVSLCLHALLFATLVWTTWSVLRPPADSSFEARVRDAAEDDVLKFPGETLLQPPDIEIPTQSNFDLAELSAPQQSDLKDLNTGSGVGDDTGGFGLGDLGRSGLIGTGAGAGDGGGAGLGEGLGAGSGVGQAGVWNLRVAGNKFVYVVDFSGSIVTVVNDLKRELKRSIGRLRAGQAFNVILFYGEVRGAERYAVDPFAPELQPATDEMKRNLFEWLDRKSPQGGTLPVPAMRRALACKPEAVFFFSDGEFEDSYVDDITLANRQAKAQLHCIVFDEMILSDNSGMVPRLTDGAKRLKRLAELNKGKTKIVTGADLRK